MDLPGQSTLIEVHLRIYLGVLSSKLKTFLVGLAASCCHMPEAFFICLGDNMPIVINIQSYSELLGTLIFFSRLLSSQPA